MTNADPVYCVLPKRHSTTIFGAIGSTLSEPYFMCAKSTNQKDFRKFLKNLKTKVKPELAGRGNQKAIVATDNASSHKTVSSRKCFEQLFTPLFQPPHSCRFNSIEIIWGLAKQEVRKQLMARSTERDITKREFEKLVLTACEKVAGLHWKKVVAANHKYISSMLEPR